MTGWHVKTIMIIYVRSKISTCHNDNLLSNKFIQSPIK